jgi:hypothetical protein
LKEETSMSKKLTAVLLFLLAGCYDAGSTSIIGYIVKMDGEGLVWRTMEVKLMEGSMNSGHVSREITVPPELVPAFQKAQDDACLVKVTFRRELFVAPWRGSTTAIAVNIERLLERKK